MGIEGGTQRLTSRSRRTLTIGASVVACAWLGLRGVPTMVTQMRDASDLLESRQELLQRLRGELGGLDALADTTKLLQARVIALAPRILSGGSDIEAAADLAARVSHASDVGAVKLTGVEPTTDSAVAGGLRRVGVRARFEGDIRGTVETLRTLEKDPGALDLDDLRVLALEPTSEESRPEILRVELTVRGWHQLKAKNP